MAATDGYYTRITLSPKAGAGAESLENLEATIGWIAKNSKVFTGTSKNSIFFQKE